MSDRRLGAILSLVRQSLQLDVEFGTRSLESLVRIAEIVEESVYVPGSLRATASGIRFSLGNAPLRLGAFRSVAVHLNGIPAAPTAVRFRSEQGEWRSAASVDRGRPIVLLPGQTTDFEVDASPPPTGELRVRLEFESVAIPPRVWFEFREPLGAAREPA
jgi:hypothetical protein